MNDWVAPGPNGGFDVYKNGEFQGNFDSQSTAKQMLNYLNGGPALTQPEIPAGRQHGEPATAPGSAQGALPATVDPMLAWKTSEGNWEIQRLQLEYQYARMNLVDAVNSGVAKDAQKANEKYQDALVALQKSQQEQTALQNQTQTQTDIWKEQNRLAGEAATRGGRYHAPANKPELPPAYYAQSGLSALGQGGQAGSPAGGQAGQAPSPSPTPTGATSPSSMDLSLFDSLDELEGKLNPEQQAKNEKQAAMLIRYYQKHPESVPGWAGFAKEHQDMTGDSGGWTGPGAAGSASGSLNYFGGQWDSSRGRQPGADDAGSVQKLHRDTLQKIKQSAQTGQDEDIWKKYLGGA